MNKTVTITSKNHNSNTYGGNICASDFCTDYEITRNIASHIVSDWKFDARCKKQMENNIKNYRERKLNNGR